jgi:hypothetical protein
MYRKNLDYLSSPFYDIDFKALPSSDGCYHPLIRDFNSFEKDFNRVFEPKMAIDINEDDNEASFLISQGCLIGAPIKDYQENLNNEYLPSLNPVILNDKGKLIQNNKSITKATDEKELFPLIIIDEIKKSKIFKIKKINKNMGRKPIKYIFVPEIIDKMHTNKKFDNIVMKIKKHLYRNSLDFINMQLKESKNPALKHLSLLKIKDESSVVSVHNRKKNLELLNINLKEIFYNILSSKYRNKNSDHNIKAINKILREKDVTINVILNTNFKEVLEIYIKKVKNEFFKKFKTIEYDITYFMKKKIDGKYIELYRYVAENFEEIIMNVKPRPNRIKKNSFE